ncbi:MAG TPA: hypothetical protein VNW97_02170 [Candidatus Saccharimonadales bacterium]|jgi:hypothetical protein|nr:hypothetical protein [Candidatus Saccharimonadales bacterium]
MNDTRSLILAIFVIGAAYFYKRIAGRADFERIIDYVTGGGSEVVDIVWKRFGEGWLGSGNQRIYEVTFRLSDGHIRTAMCKTSWLGGIYWSGGAPPAPPARRPQGRSQTAS